MKRMFIVAALATAAVPALAQVGVSIGIGDPGFYGQIVIGNAPPPRLVYAQPVVVAPVPAYVGAAPIYLRVPPDEIDDWRDHCEEYRACGRPVYFVRDDWYRDAYAPYRREHRGAREQWGRHRGDGDHDQADHRRDHGHFGHGGDRGGDGDQGD